MEKSNPKANFNPPKWAVKFLYWFCTEELVEEIEGDLFEFYQEQRKSSSRWKANLVYWYHLFQFLRPFAFKRRSKNSNRIVMFRNHFTIARRVIERNKFYSFLNLMGLSLGVAAALFIFLFVRDEFSYDRYNKDHDRIFRIVTDFKLGDRQIHNPITPNLMAAYIEETIPEIETAGRLMIGNFTSVVDLGSQQYQIKNATYATTEILSIFTIDFLQGNPKNALDEPKTAVISESMAAHLFPGKEAFGQTVTYNNTPFIIKGIFKDMPDNGHVKFDFMMSVMYQDSRYAEDYTWMSNNSYTYIKLKSGASPEEVERKIDETIASHVAPIIEQTLQVPADEIQSNGNHAHFYLQPLTDIHLKSNLSREILPNGSITTVRTISMIGLIILVVACINFVNLSTARAAIRGKEVGVRKVIGSQRRQLVSQFLFESTLFSVLSVAFAAVIVALVLPSFNQLAGKEIAQPFGGTPPLWLIMLIGSIVLGLFAGAYPAFLLSSFKPIKTLKGQNQLQTHDSWLRGSLVVFQFAISTVLIIATLVVNNQLNYISEMELGFNKNQVIKVGIMDLNRYQPNSEALKNKLSQQPNIESISLGDYVPVAGDRSEVFLKRRDDSQIDETITTQAWPIQKDYFKTWDIEFLDGEDFNYTNDSSATFSIILNETAVKALNLAEPLNSALILTSGQKNIDVRVVGVVKDFHYASVRETIKPLIFYKGSTPWTLSIRFNGKPSEAMATVQEAWQEHSGGQPFVASLVSEDYKNMYASENNMKVLINSFSGLAIVIAIIGLFGLATFMAEQRKKEMGIRKILGANSLQLFFNLLNSFTKLVFIACVLAIPVAYFLISGWLNEFVYRIEPSPLLFVGAAFLMLALAWVTVSYQSLKVTRKNPVENLNQQH